MVDTRHLQSATDQSVASRSSHIRKQFHSAAEPQPNVKGASVLDKMWWFGKNAISWEDGNAMQEFIAKHKEEIAGVLSGFDRLVFRGTLRSISYAEGMMGYLWAKQVRLTEFGKHVLRVSERLKQACKAKAEALGRPVKYLVSAGESKEEVARGIAARDKIEEGLVCVLSCVETCRTTCDDKSRLHHNQAVRRRLSGLSTCGKVRTSTRAPVTEGPGSRKSSDSRTAFHRQFSSNATARLHPGMRDVSNCEKERQIYS
jgi:hypothetical protein